MHRRRPVPQSSGYVITRAPVAPEPLIDRVYDYADTFAISLDEADAHTAEEWVRAALAHAAPAVLATIRFVHGRIARFSLSSAPDSVLGWRTLSSSRDAFHIATQGPLLRAEIVTRRTSPTTATLTTFLFYERRATRLLWLLIGPLHRRIAPYLLAGAADSLTRSAEAS